MLVTAAGPAIIQALLRITIDLRLHLVAGRPAGPRGQAACAVGVGGVDLRGEVNDLRTWFLTFAFVAIGLEFSLKGLREAGWRPIAVFASATVVNIVVALGLATGVVRHFHHQLAVTLGPCRHPGRGEAFSR